MERKSYENLDAARLLLEQEDPCTNAAASRAYFAVYQACWTALVERGVPVPNTLRGRYFPHEKLPQQMLERGLLSEKSKDDLVFLANSRIMADYYDEDITLPWARECLEVSRRLAVQLLG